MNSKKNTGKVMALSLIAALMLLSLFGCTGPTPAPDPIENPPADNQPAELSGEIIVSAAMSLKEVMSEIQPLYKAKQPQATITFNFGSSGSLQQQIEQGAPADLFFSAGQKQMTALTDANLMLSGSVKDLLENKVVLIANPKKTDITGFEDLVTDKVELFALGEPSTSPAGQYGLQVLETLGLLEGLKNKTVYGKDVKEIITWVTTGDADAGIVYSTDAKSVGAAVVVTAVAPDGSCPPIVYPAGIVHSTQNPNLAADFMNFLSTDQAKAVFEKYGFVAK